ncbi:MAG: sigma-70 family RNA polymerase sigma factor [Candidatus Pacebacteria bacterium]|nr:sigma-70 family RNA polymerase sigma factor [Candidatus Paceibacterota bacterium]
MAIGTSKKKSDFVSIREMPLSEIIRISSAANLGPNATIYDIARAIGFSSKSIAVMKAAGESRYVDPLIDEKQTSSDDRLNETFGKIEERIIDPNPVDIQKTVEDNFLKEDAISALSILSKRDQNILKLRFGLEEGNCPHTLEEIGNILGLSRERIRQLQDRALERLRNNPDVNSKLRPYY